MCIPDNPENQINALKEEILRQKSQISELEESNKILTKRNRDVEAISLKLIDSQEKLKKYIEYSSVAIFGIDGAGNFLYTNAAALMLTGYERHELAMQNINNLINIGFDNLQKSKPEEKGKINTYETQIHKKNGVSAYILVDWVRISENEIVAFCNDITLKKQASKQEILFSTVYENAPDGIFLLNRQLEIINCNKEFTEQTGLIKEEILGREFHSFYKIELGREELLEKIKKGVTAEFEEIQEKKGTYPMYVWVKIVGLRDENGEITGNVAFVRDVSEIKLAEIEIKDNYNEIAGQNEEIALANEKLIKLNYEQQKTNIKLEEALKKHREISSKLLDAQNHYKIIAENTGDFITTITFTVNPKFIYTSPSYKKLGYLPGELKDKTVMDFIHKDDHPKVLNMLEKHLLKKAQNLSDVKAGEELNLELKFKTKKDQWKELDCTVNFTEHAILINSHDNSYRKEKEKIINKQNSEIIQSNEKLRQLNILLRKSEETYKNIYNSTEDALFIHDILTGRIIDVNFSATKMYECTKHELLNSMVSSLSSEDSAYNYENAILKIQNAAQGEAQTFTWQARTLKGRSFWVIVSLKKAIIAGKERIIAVVKDIDELKIIQDNLKESEEKFKQLAEMSPTGIFIYQNNKFVYANKSCTSIIGYTINEIIGMHFWDTVHPDMRDVVRENGQRRQTGEQLKSRYEMKLITKYGETRWVDFNGTNIIFNNKPAAIGNIIDITDLKKTIEQEQKGKKEAVEADKLKSAFLANMSHEIRTPMNGILGFAQLLDTDELSSFKRKEYLNIINSSGKQLLNIIDDILDISKIESGQLKISKIKTNISKVIRETYESFKNNAKIELKTISFMAKIDENNPNIEIYTDEFRIKQILFNLISNSLKFTQQGYIEFGYELESEFIKFYVKDTGIGIPTDKQHIIFSRFGQIEPEYTKIKGGTGIGLAISKGLTELLGGTITFESAENRGTTFTFTIPKIFV